MKTLLKYMLDVALGMHYISEKGLVHRVRMLVVGCSSSETPLPVLLYIGIMITKLIVMQVLAPAMSSKINAIQQTGYCCSQHNGDS